MKTTARTILLFLVITGQFCFTAFSQDIAEKKFSKVWSSSEKKLFQLFHKYGNVTMKAWDKNEISVEVSIRVENYPKAKAEEYLQLIDISFIEKDSLLKLVTNYDEKVEKALSNQSGNKKIQVDYTIMHPVYQKVEINNRYGNVSIGELNGKSSFFIKYGDFKAENMIFDETKPFSLLDISYGKATITKTTWMQFKLKYSDIKVEEATAMIIISTYSNISGGVIHSVVSDSKYDNYNIFKVKNFVIDTKYSDLTINEAGKQVHTTLEYGNLKIKSIPSGFEKIKIDSKYSECVLEIDEAACYQLKGHVEYGSFSIPQKSSITRKKDELNETVEGWVGCNEGGTSLVEINGKYSEFKLVK